jgi:hypothetical protein
VKTFIAFDIGRFWFDFGWFPGEKCNFHIRFYEKHYDDELSIDPIAITYLFLKIFKFSIGFGCECEK